MPNPRKPTDLHVIEGTLHPTKHKSRANEPKPKGRPRKPSYFTKKHFVELENAIAALEGNDPRRPPLIARLAVDRRAAKIWNEDLSIAASWLTSADARPFAEWCRMSADLEISGDKEPAWRAQWRMIGQELGFFAGSRSRLNTSPGKKTDDDPASEYLN